MQSSSDPSYPIVLHVYDLSQGMARSMSQMFLGRQIEGIWHTGIVVYGQEYYFGGGICAGPPKNTPYGSPTKIERIGETEIPQELFHDFLREISPKFTMNTYDLFKNNCNNFTEECCQFLTGTSIPSYIIGLPAEVLSTPFGKMIEPMINNLQSQMLDSSSNQLLPGMFEGMANPQALNFNNPSNNVNMSQNFPQPAPKIPENQGNVDPVEEINSAAQLSDAIANNKAVVVDFYSLTCPPCRRIKPIYHAIAKDTSSACPSIKFLACNIANNRDISSQLQIQSIPTFVFFHNRGMFHRFSGANEAEIRKTVNNLRNLVGTTDPSPSPQNFGQPSQPPQNIEKKPAFAFCRPENYEFYLYRSEKKDFPVNKIKGLAVDKLRNPQYYETFLEMAANIDVAIQYFIPEKKRAILGFLGQNIESYIDDFSMDSLPFFDLLRMLMGESSYSEIFFEEFDKTIDKLTIFTQKDCEADFKIVEKPVRVLILRILCNAFSSEVGKREMGKRLEKLLEIALKCVSFFLKTEKMVVESAIMLALNCVLLRKSDKSRFLAISKEILLVSSLPAENSSDMILFGTVLMLNSMLSSDASLIPEFKALEIEKLFDRAKVSKNERLVLAVKDCQSLLSGKLR